MKSEVPADVVKASATAEGFLLWLTIAMIIGSASARGNHERARRTWARGSVAALLREAALCGDLSAAMPKHWEQLEVALACLRHSRN